MIRTSLRTSGLLFCLIALMAPAMAGDHPALLDPSKTNETAPATFLVKFETTKGDFTVKFHREWAPIGVDRLYNLVVIGYFSEIPFYRVVDGFVAQFGFHGNPKVNAKWAKNSIKDEPTKQSNTAGRFTFANRGPNTRATQFFINTGNNSMLDRMGFAPLGELEPGGLEIVKSLYGGYGDRGGPDQRLLDKKGNDYVKKNFPKIDYIKKAYIVK